MHPTAGGAGAGGDSPPTEKESYRTATAAGGGALKVDPDLVKTRVIEYLAGCLIEYMTTAKADPSSLTNLGRNIMASATSLVPVDPMAIAAGCWPVFRGRKGLPSSMSGGAHVATSLYVSVVQLNSGSGELIVAVNMSSSESIVVTLTHKYLNVGVISSKFRAAPNNAALLLLRLEPGEIHCVGISQDNNDIVLGSTCFVHLGEPMSLSSATRKYLADADVNAAWERSQLNVVRQVWSFETQLGTVYPALLRSVQPEQLYDFLAQVSALGAPGIAEGVSKEVMLRCPSDLWHRFFALLLVRDWNAADGWVEGRALLNSLPQDVQDHVKSALGELRRSATPDPVSGSGLFSAPIWYPLGSPSVVMHPYDIPLTPLTAVVGALQYLAATHCPTTSDMAMKMTQLYALLPHGFKVGAPCTGGSEKVVVRTQEWASWIQKVFDVAGLGQVTAELVQKISETTVSHASVFGLLDTVTKEKEVSTLLHQAADLWVKKAVAAGSTDEVKIECQKEALSAFLAAAAINPTNADVLSNAAHMSFQLAPAIQGKTESLRSDAKVFTEDALQLHPEHLHALQLQANLHLQNKKWVQAGTALEKLKAAAEAQFPQPTSGGAAAEPPLQQQQSARAKEIFDSYAKMEKHRQRYLKIEKEKLIRSLAQQQQQEEPASTGGGETKPTKTTKHGK